MNLHRVDRWKDDVVASVDLYNTWFLNFAPKTFRETRIETTKQVVAALKATNDLARISAADLAANPSVVPILRMSTAPPIAFDRLVGLSHANPNLVACLEEGALPVRMDKTLVTKQMDAIGDVIVKLLDHDLFPWLQQRRPPSEPERERAASIVADRLCGAAANPIIRNEQERRQLAVIKAWLEKRGYKHVESKTVRVDSMQPGTFAFRLNVPIKQEGSEKSVNIPVDAAIARKNAKLGDLPLMVEAKSAGDFTNTNKRRKEEAVKLSQLRTTYGPKVEYVLFLCGYFDTGYLGYEAAEGLDWVWEHRIDDFQGLGL